MAVKSVRSPSISTSSTLVDTNIPLPSISITNKPSSGTSLYHTCRSVLDKLTLVEGMLYYLDAEIPMTPITPVTPTTPTANGPLNKLWELCRKGAPLATLFNSLNPVEPLNFNQNANQQNECKKIVYHFIVACRNQLSFNEDQLFTLSDLYQDNTNGFIKVINTINLILNSLEEKGIISYSSINRNSFNQPKDTRDKVVNELLETERKYVQDMEILQNYMRELQIQEILNPDTIHYLFGNLNTLVDFQRRFLIQLEEMGEKPSEEQNFGGLFKQQEEQFTVYEPYCSNYFNAQELVVQETPKLQKLADILNPSYELPSMLVKPVQRICKYPLLLQQLLKSTNSDWPYVDELEQGLVVVKRVAERVNETQRKYENIQVVQELKKRIDELRSTQIDQYGSLLLHEKLTLRYEDESEKEMYIYFFEKTMLLCKESKDSKKNNPNIIRKKRRGSLQPRGMIVMSRVLNVRNMSTGEGNWSLRVDWKDSEVNFVILRFRNEEQVKLWESTLKKKITPQKSNVSNTQLASMKYMPQHITVDDDSEEEGEVQSDYYNINNYDFDQQSRVRSNSVTTNLIRPKVPRNMSVDQAFKQQQRIIPRTSSSTNTQNYYPVSPPPSNPSSPTTRIQNNKSRDSSPLIDIATKFMASGLVDSIEEDEYHPPVMNRSQSQQQLLYQQQQQQQQQQRIRSQSSPNIHQYTNHQQEWEDNLSQLPTLNRHPIENVKIKLNYNDGIYVVLCSTEITYFELIDKVERKIRLVSNSQTNDIVRLKYQDEDGDLITINSDDDVQMAFESRGNLNTINLFVTV